ncbi:MAG TPA: type II secretion system inner membrane protein GspF [Polyangia bacterium]|nr:type II secretion system inner membrane protein GspF [Polyangia bacterium]
MPVFAYKGLDSRGKPTAGVRDAESAKALRAVLRKDGVYLTDLREERAVRGGGAAVVAVAGATAQPQGLLQREVDFGRLFERVRPQEVAVLTRQLATLLRAGIPLAEGLAALTEQTDNNKLKKTLGDVKQKVNEGSALADAMADHPKVFPELYVNMVRAGETAGNLDSVLARLADFMDAQIELRGKVTNALMYPAIMIGVGIIIMSILMIAVVPKITAIFDDSGKSLPWNTQLLIFVSKVTGDYWWILLPLAVLGVFLLRRWVKTPEGRAKWDRMVLRLWVIGPLARMVAISRFAKTLGTMLSAGVPLLRAMDITKDILGNRVLEKVVEEARNSIREGESIAAPLKRSGQFPPIVTHMIAVGERSGQLEQMLENVASAYDREVELKVSRLTTLLEPAMILLMSSAVAFVVFSILMPILEMNEWVS